MVDYYSKEIYIEKVLPQTSPNSTLTMQRFKSYLPFLSRCILVRIPPGIVSLPGRPRPLTPIRAQRLLQLPSDCPVYVLDQIAIKKTDKIWGA